MSYVIYKDQKDQDSIYLIFTEYHGYARLSRNNQDLLFSIHTTYKYDENGNVETEEEFGVGGKIGLKPNIEFDDLLDLLQDPNIDLEEDIIDWTKNNTTITADDVRENIKYIISNFTQEAVVYHTN